MPSKNTNLILSLPKNPFFLGTKKNSPQMEEGQRSIYTYATDTEHKKKERVAFTSPDGLPYTKSVEDEPVTLREYTNKERKKIAKKKISKLYVDPISENDYKPIRYTQEEVNAFNRHISEGKLVEALRGKGQYVANAPKHAKGVARDPEEKDPDGTQQADIYDPEAQTIPQETWNDPFCFVRGRFSIMMKQHPFVKEVMITLAPMCFLPLQERPSFQKDELIRKVCRGGLHCVHQKPTSDEKHLILQFRFVEVDEAQDTLDRQAAIAKKDELSTVDWDTINSLLEDYLRVNVIAIASDTKTSYRMGVYFFSV